MQPDEKSASFRIPMTVDVKNNYELSGAMKIFWCITILILYMLLSFVFIALIPYKLITIGVLIVVFLVVQYLIRLLILRERKYKNATEELEAKKFQVSYREFWNILEIEDAMPYTVRHTNGVVSFFIKLEKKSKVGASENAEFLHHEAVSDALKLFSRRKIQFKRVDYMDKISKDKRIKVARSQYDNTPTALKRYLHSKYDFLENHMSYDYATYDVIVAYMYPSMGNELTLYEAVKEFSEYLVLAHYSRAVLMNRKDIEELSQSLLNSEEFNYIDATDSVMSEEATSALKKIYTVDRQGVKTVHSLTVKEKEEQDRIAKQEKKLGSKARKAKRKLAKDGNEEINFNSTATDDGEQGTVLVQSDRNIAMHKEEIIDFTNGNKEEVIDFSTEGNDEIIDFSDDEIETLD